MILNRFVHKHFRNAACRFRVTLATEATFEDGVYRWKSNGRCVPPYVLLENGVGYNDRQCRAHMAETEAILASYRKAMRGSRPTAEERYEMRAAFGPGETVVNVITGDKYTT